MDSFDSELNAQLMKHLDAIYPDGNSIQIAASICELLDGKSFPEVAPLWTEQETLLITYGDSLVQLGEVPLETLRHFLDTTIENTISMVHVLPFCPYSSDDGFSVIDYTLVNGELGTWHDLQAISEKYRLMADLVINHVSAQSEWFQNYLHDRQPGKSYFVEVESDADVSNVVRPRSSPLLRTVETKAGIKQVWCTFSHDQVDLNFSNPDVLIEFLKIILLYLEQGVRVFRLDAIGYLWKELGTPCIHLPQTHELVRLIRTICDYVAPGTILITETNVPNQENLSYFGNCNEAHIIYNFSLAPLVLQALLTGKSDYLKSWMMSMPPAPIGCTYLNFTASHDGIGMRPAEGLLTEQEQNEMVAAIEKFGGKVSKRSSGNGKEKVYELNISLFDALQGTAKGADRHQVNRFLCSQTIMMGLEGIPAFYIHSLLATPNDNEAVNRTGQNRSINRHQWNMADLREKLADENSKQHQVSEELLRRIRIRTQQPAFHPHATQFTLQLKPYFFGFWRQSMDRQQSIFAVHNLSSRKRKLELREINLICNADWIDLLSGCKLNDISETIDLEPYQCLWITNRIPSQDDAKS